MMFCIKNNAIKCNTGVCVNYQFNALVCYMFCIKNNAIKCNTGVCVNYQFNALVCYMFCIKIMQLNATL